MAAAQASQCDLKLIIVGDSGAGKTALLKRFHTNEFEPNHATTVGTAFYVHDYGGVKFGLWDTAGQERYAKLAHIYSRDANIVLLCYDITSKDSFERIPFWKSQLNALHENCIFVLVGCKLDLVESPGHTREVTFSEAAGLQEQLGAMRSFETSSKTGENVRDVFTFVCKHFGGSPTPRSSTGPVGSESISLSASSQGTKSQSQQGPQKCC